MPLVDAETSRLTRQVMERQVQHLVRLVDDLLDVSRVMRGRIELRREHVELAAVIARAVETAKPVVDAKSHRLKLEIADDSMGVRVDPVRMTQVLGNLLTNAARYTADGGKIDLSARREGSDAVVEIRDNGVGIASKMLPLIFELFVQADPAGPGFEVARTTGACRSCATRASRRSPGGDSRRIGAARKKRDAIITW